MKTHISRAKAYLLLAEAALTEVRMEVDSAADNPKMTDDEFLDIAIDVRNWIKTTVKQLNIDENYVISAQFRAYSEGILLKIDRILGQELVFEEISCQKQQNLDLWP